VILLFTGPHHRRRSFPALSEFEIIGTLWVCEIGLVCSQHRGCWTCVGLQMGSNFLGPFTLTIRLLPLMFTAEAPRVATMSSLATHYSQIRFQELQWERRYSPNLTYAQSKLADLMFTQHLAAVAAQRDWNLTSTAAQPRQARLQLLPATQSIHGRAPGAM
jgi:NAD(P)-dependent dehydrogenase (short-subunit alcohol dehydrogenase family)